MRCAASSALALVFSLFGPGTAGAHPAILVGGDTPAFREAVEGARALLPDAHVYQLPSAASDLNKDHPEVVVAIGSGALKAAAELHPMPPTVFLLVADPQAIVGPLNGRPLIGIGLTSPQAILETLRKLVPKARHLWTVYCDKDTGPQVEQLRAAAAKEGYHLTTSEVGSPETAMRNLLSPPSSVDAYVMLPDAVVRNSATDEALIKLAFERRFIVVGASFADVRRGALFALQLDARALGRQAGELAKKINAVQAGVRSSIVPPSGYRLVLNASTAEYLGISLPADVRQSAAAVIGR